MIIFLWTPPHSWALALYKSGDYAAAGVPMMPVAKGAKSTRLQILLYSIVMVVFAGAPVLTGLGGLAYAATSLGGGALFLLLAIRVFNSRAGEAGSAEDGRALRRSGRRQGGPGSLRLFDRIPGCVLFAALIFEHGLGGYMAVPGVSRMSQDIKEDAVQKTEEALDKATPQEAEAIAEQASFLTAREGQASGEHVALSPEELAARKKRNVAIALEPGRPSWF